MHAGLNAVLRRCTRHWMRAWRNCKVAQRYESIFGQFLARLPALCQHSSHVGQVLRLRSQTLRMIHML